MADRKFDITRRKALLGLGGIGAGATLGGAGTMALFNDKEKSENNAVTAGELDLQIDWWQRYYQGRATPKDNGSESGLTNNPGPIFQIGDAKPGDWGCGLISLHVFDNPAYVWAGCDLKEKENGRTEPEKKVDETKHKGELAENIKVALLRFPYISGTGALATEQAGYQAAMKAHGFPGDRDMKNIAGCHSVFVTTLKDLCEKKLHHGHLLDGRPYKEGKGCFKRSHTYFYGFCWWIPKTVGNEIQSDKVRFDLKFGAVQCRHVKNPRRHNPFDPGTLVLNESASSGLDENAANKSANRPYVDWTIDANEITFEFHNPTNVSQVFDYRVDGEPGTSHRWTDETISEGPLQGEKFGLKHNLVAPPKGGSKTVTVSASEKVEVISRLGGEQNWYIPWIRLEVEK